MIDRILIVDDEPLVLEVLRDVLTSEGFTVSQAPRAELALEMLGREPHALVLCDIRMPGMDGFELLKAVRRSHPGTDVIMMTGFVTQSNVIGCMEAGADTCIFKPIQRIALLEEAVQRAVDDQVRWWQVLAELRQLRTKRSA